MRSIPKLGQGHIRLQPIGGSPVDLLNMPKGCAFASRCDRAMKVCLNEQPEEITVNAGHRAACWVNVKNVYEEAAKGGDAK